MIKFFKKLRQELIMENNTAKYLKYAFGEILLVVIGILVALWINNWNETNKIEANTKQTLERIKNEILANQKKIDLVNSYHLMVKDTLENIHLPKTDEETKSALSFWKGLNIPRLQESSFQTAIQTGISKDMDVDLLESLNELYTFQETYNEFGKTASSALYDKDFSSVNNFKQIAVFLHMVMSDLYYFEIGLNSRFKASLTKIDSLNH
jgi:hypothetical protein